MKTRAVAVVLRSILAISAFSSLLTAQQISTPPSAIPERRPAILEMNDPQQKYPQPVGANGTRTQSTGLPPTIPDRMVFRATASKKIDTKTAKAGDKVRMTVIAEEILDDGAVIPAGTRLEGIVAESNAFSPSNPEARLSILINRLQWKQQWIPMHGFVVALGEVRTTYQNTFFDMNNRVPLSASGVLSDFELQQTGNPPNGSALISRKGNIVVKEGMAFVIRNVSQQASAALAIAEGTSLDIPQRKKSEESASFRSQSSLVLVPVQVRNKGHHVAGLPKDKFTVLQDGKEQRIAIFEEVHITTQRLQRAVVGPKEFSNQLQGSPDLNRYTVIAIDRINTGAHDMNRVRDGIAKFLGQATDTGEPIRLIAIEKRGIRLLQDFTTDPKAIAAAFARPAAVGQSLHSDAGLPEAREEIERAQTELATSSDSTKVSASAHLDQANKDEELDKNMLAIQEKSARITSLEALQNIALSVHGLPGRKSLLWVSSGYPFGMGIAESDLWDETTNLLNSATVSMYTIDARGPDSTALAAIDVSRSGPMSSNEYWKSKDAHLDVYTTFQHLAETTGGKPCVEQDDISGCLKGATDDSRDYYMLGFYLDRASTKDGWHKLQAKVAEQGTSVRGRNGFLYPVPDFGTDNTIAAMLDKAGIPFRGRWTDTETRGDKRAARFEINVGPDANVIEAKQNKLNLEIAGVARAKDGSIAAEFGQEIARTLTTEALANVQKTGIQYRSVLVLAPGDYQVRFVVRDSNTGKVGIVDSQIKIE